MKFTTLELGPRLNAHAPDFQLVNHENQQIGLKDLLGARGLLLGFTGDVWHPASVRRIFWLQRYAPRFLNDGVASALLICDKPHVLFGYYMSSETALSFPLLADAEREVHRQFNMERYAGLVLIDAQGILRDKWLVPDERVWPKAQELDQAVALLRQEP